MKILNKELTKFADTYRTDKGTLECEGHSFTEFYDDYLKDWRDRELNILEIGVQTGASLLMWQSYFPKATVYGLDINDVDFSKYAETEEFKNIQIRKCDATNENQVKEFLNDIGNIKFDIIVDDGSHDLNHQMKSLLLFLDNTKDDGMYIIEDLHTSLDNGTDTPLYFLASGKKIPRITEEEYTRLHNRIDNVIVFNRKNPRGGHGFSITSIIRFE